MAYTTWLGYDRSFFLSFWSIYSYLFETVTQLAWALVPGNCIDLNVKNMDSINNRITKKNKVIPSTQHEHQIILITALPL